MVPPATELPNRAGLHLNSPYLEDIFVAMAALRKYLEWMSRGWASLLKRLSGDLSIVPELKFQLFNHLGQPLPREGIGGFQSEPAGLLQLLLKYSKVRPRHLIAPDNWVAVWGSSGTSPTRE